MELIKTIKTEIKPLSKIGFKIVDLDCKNSENEDFPFLSESLEELLKGKLEEKGFKFEDLKVYYNLSYSQGDHFYFEGEITTKNAIFILKNKNIDISQIKINKKYAYIEDLNQKQQLKGDILLKEFEDIYHSLCNELKQIGYKEIEYQLEESILKAGFKDFLETLIIKLKKKRVL